MSSRTIALRANTDAVIREDFRQLTLPFKPTRRERFERLVDRSAGPLACHPWRGSVMQANRYGQWRDKSPTTGKTTMRTAHRVAYEMVHGPIPEGMHVLHSRVCTTRLCCNAERHLRLGNQSDNELDKPAAVRSKRLKSADAREILSLHKSDGATVEALAHRFNVSDQAIKRVLAGKTHSKATGIVYVPKTGGRPPKVRLAA